ncbi:4,5-DOPA dioxygenase extradiol [Novosphingobium album (ex Liu et al. 2023)]|uniref:4,5-DOPA dioxygenase extradiol n=1 Tax=Novosphingobium album (ex Liu et al. 2023) TaxID=3031130 RepID=A0ABT5WKX6_9SPHN|nr:4,5-DOPA dioxygenase extradiol [Novosphingobium album (ex Liu et al. 2023)]MDE8650693.1 4,5-DOPA dioxygenase extradiol [Novosphingobium album (ex Liu et al. 2023)]
MNQTAPALFVGHGSPMTLITENPERRTMERLGGLMARPEAILCITAHWETSGHTHLTDGPAPRTIHDFRGFPQALYDMRYPAPGSAELAAKVTAALGADRVSLDTQWGFDHGVWGVLLPMFPGADIPVVAMSLDRSLDPTAHLALGKALAPLRREGVMIVGSGNIVHNLALWRASVGTRPDWAIEFQDRINRAMADGDPAALTRFAPSDKAAAAAINSAEHFLPLLYVAGARLEEDALGVFNDTIDGSLSMTSYFLGDAATRDRLTQ